ncbi:MULTISPECIES: sugar phosphate isomerase/epimerase [Agrobacterium]|uniref:Sugar phosphate isomerase/epimerase n=1 Tax=Agrobacterium tumefaciens TaxID=358 RepID=A0AAE6BGZ2_AGRTU|nr:MULTISPECIES: sugar phosphate isomerase/epimerase family protein [Agrobacterium]QCL77046.1 sugar phosphate isomerase/epimerase [Agrobacterium tumefaciens]QCL82553.1 sugar phosphate isomerase/epimerase [Agrobacterium tumefaciens]CUX71086.1 Xylose isomerase domain-containing protein [Agrobacterium sp. NCPPB 925]
MRKLNPSFTVNTYSYTSRFSAVECLRHVSDMGFSGFEMMLIPGHFWPSTATVAERKAIKDLLNERNIRIYTLNQPNLDVNLAALTPECRKYSCDVVASALEVAADWGAIGVVVNPGKTNPVFPASSDKLTECFQSSLDTLVKRAADLQVKLIVKNHPLSWLYRGADLLSFFDRYGWTSIGLGYDVANAAFGHDSTLDALPQLKEHLLAVYVADTPLEEFRHDPVGGGAVSFEPIAKVLDTIDYRGPSIFEIVSADPDEALLSSASLLTPFWQTRSDPFANAVGENRS